MMRRLTSAMIKKKIRKIMVGLAHDLILIASVLVPVAWMVWDWMWTIE